MFTQTRCLSRSLWPHYCPDLYIQAAVRDRNKDPALTRSLARSDGEVEPGDEMAAVLAL